MTLCTRRELLGQAAALALSGCVTSPQKKKPPGHGPEDGEPGAELVERSVDELQRDMSRGRRSARRITELYLRRIEALDPRLHALIEVNPEALATAERLDRERAAGRVRGPLHGVAVLLKDNIDTADRMTTTAGSLALEGSIPARDAALVRRLRGAGAILIGKANMSEWANFRSGRSTSGWSARGGQCRSPYALDRNPCGSSSGSAVAAAASMTAVAVGTETDGSIICPASASGVVGLKPTVGLVSRSGIIPISASQDTAGPMGRTVRDVAIVLGVMAGADPADPATRGARAHRDYTRFLTRGKLDGVRVGVARELTGFHAGTDAVFEAALAALRDLGAQLVDPAPELGAKKLGKLELELLLYEFKDGLNRYLGGLARGNPAPVRSLADVIRFNRRHARRELAHFGQDLLVKADRKGPLTEPAYLEARDTLRRLAREQGIDAALSARRLDLIVAPSGSPAWKTDPICGDHFLGGSSGMAAVAGYPNITVPAGQVRGLPVGISLFGAAWSEPTLLRVAHAFERATRHRRPPRFRRSVDAV
jgi:amidase